MSTDQEDTVSMHVQLGEISNTVKLLEKFQWVSNGVAIAVVFLGGYIWNTTNHQINDLATNYRTEVKYEILMDAMRVELTTVEQSIVDGNKVAESNQARVDQLEKDLIQLQHKGK